MSEPATPFSDSELNDLDDELSDVPPTPPAAPTIVESLVAGRVRRPNAGNLLAKLLTQEADEEDTLFLEDEDDAEFQFKGGRNAVEDEDDDALMESSTDDDEYDAGPPAPGDDEQLEGEKEIERAEKEARKARKRKADDAFLRPRRRGAQALAAPKRRVTIREEKEERERLGAGVAEEGDGENDEDDDEDDEDDEGIVVVVGGEGDNDGRPRKKLERISWVPEFVATRASSRTLSLQNRSETMRRLEESEKRRLHTIALMEKAAAKKDKVRPKKEMTQEERLAEARITERRNKKSLCSWEETEKAKLEEQREKLAALQNRRLAGPVITYWSGRAEWSGDTRKLMKVGKGLMVEEVSDEEVVLKKKRGRKGKERELAAEDRATAPKDTIQVTAVRLPSMIPPMIPEPITTPPPPQQFTTPANTPELSALSSLPPQASSTPPDPPPTVTKKDFPTFLEGVLDYAVPPPQFTPKDPAIAAPAQAQASVGAATAAPLLQEIAAPVPTTAVTVPTVATAPAPPPKSIEPSVRNLILLENFDHLRDKASVVRVLWGDQQRRHPTIKPQCIISNEPAKFRDPATGMPFASLHAYREIRRLLHGEIAWSCVLGAYVGEARPAARGVPEGF